MKNKRCDNCGSTNFKEGELETPFMRTFAMMNLVGSFQEGRVQNY